MGPGNRRPEPHSEAPVQRWAVWEMLEEQGDPRPWSSGRARLRSRWVLRVLGRPVRGEEPPTTVLAGVPWGA